MDHVSRKIIAFLGVFHRHQNVSIRFGRESENLMSMFCRRVLGFSEFESMQNVQPFRLRDKLVTLAKTFDSMS